jgi:hypothetical protein
MQCVPKAISTGMGRLHHRPAVNDGRNVTCPSIATSGGANRPADPVTPRQRPPIAFICPHRTGDLRRLVSPTSLVFHTCLIASQDRGKGPPTLPRHTADLSAPCPMLGRLMKTKEAFDDH